MLVEGIQIHREQSSNPQDALHCDNPVITVRKMMRIKALRCHSLAHAPSKYWLLRTPSAANQILSTIVAPFYPYLTFHLIKYSYSTIVTLKCFCYVNNSIVLHFLHSVPV